VPKGAPSVVTAEMGLTSFGWSRTAPNIPGDQCTPGAHPQPAMVLPIASCALTCSKRLPEGAPLVSQVEVVRRLMDPAGLAHSRRMAHRWANLRDEGPSVAFGS
jgi:hypothetical protein